MKNKSYNHPAPLVLLILFFLLPFFWAISCKKPVEPELIKLHPEFLEYTYFKDGTYWVYQDSATGNTDSFSVQNSRIFIEEDKGGRNGPARKREVYNYELVKNNYDFLYNYTGGGVCSRNQEPLEGACFVVKYSYKNSSEGLHTDFFYYKPIKGSIYTAPFTKTTILDNYVSLSMNNTTYFHVTKVHVDVDTQNHNRETYFYVAKNYGIIRKEINIGTNSLPQWQVWDLVRYNIIQ